MITVAAWARTLGISRQSAAEAVARCGIPVVDKKIDADKATALYKKNTRQRVNENKHPVSGAPAPAARGAGARARARHEADPSDDVPAYDHSRARREAAEATKAEIEAAEAADMYLEKADVDSCMFEVARALRDGLTNCARRIAADVSALATADECEAVIEREHRTLLETMAHTLAEKLAVQMEARDQ